MENKKNSLQIMILVTIAILLLGIFLVMLSNKNNKSYQTNNDFLNEDSYQKNQDYNKEDGEQIVNIPVGDTADEKDNENSYGIDMWPRTQDVWSLSYNPVWTVEKDSNSYTFTLTSGAKIGIGGPQSACSSQNYSFQYGVSTTACIDGAKANLSVPNQTPGIVAQPTQADKNAFGDFVLANQ